MQESAFLRSPNFDVHWTGATADAISQETWNLLEDLLPDTDLATRLRFLRIWGLLTSSMETWKGMNLALLQKFDPGLKRFKHCFCKHWLEVARCAATEKVPEEPLPLCTLSKNAEGRVFRPAIIGQNLPSQFVRFLQNSMRVNDMAPSFSLQDGLHAILSLDLDWNREGASDTFNWACRTGELRPSKW